MTLVRTPRVEAPGFWGVLDGPRDWDPASAGWVCLGYDVADAGLLSGLTNCGYTAAEKDALVEDWAAHLNDLHLFGTARAAHRFAEHADRRVPEHAPFYVYGLYACAADLPAEVEDRRAPVG